MSILISQFIPPHPTPFPLVSIHLFSTSVSLFMLYFLKFIYFIYFCLCWVFVAASGGYSSLQYVGLSLWWLLLLWSPGSRRAGSVVVAHGL